MFVPLFAESSWNKSPFYVAVLQMLMMDKSGLLWQREKTKHLHKKLKPKEACGEFCRKGEAGIVF